ncbi:hypothetical protein H0H93_004340 [Arthromyces matolae]|nr:hypothetical protein H0H93_004340 [Arthromyces matolae]
MNTPLSAAPHIPIPPSFSDFKFSVIGHNEPPALLTRLSMGGGMPQLAESSHSHPHSQTPEPKLQLLYPSRSTTPWLPGNTSEPQPSSQQRHERAGYSTEPSLGDLYIPMDITEERKPIMRPETPTTSLESNHSRDGNFSLLDSTAHLQEDNLISSTSTLNHQPTTAIHSTSHQPTLTSAQTSSAPSQPTNVVEENRLSTINKELQVLELAYERALITCQKTGHKTERTNPPLPASAIPTKGNDKPDASTKYQNQNSTTTSYPNYNADVPTTSQRLPPGNLALLQRMQTMPTISAPQSPTQAQPPKISPPSPTVLGKRTYGGEPSTVTRSPGSTLPAKRPNLGNPPPAESPSLGSRIAQIPVESDYSPPPPIRFPPKQQQQQHSPPPPRDPPTRPPSGPRFNQKEPVREPYYPKKSYDSYVPSNTTTTRGDSYYNRSKAPSPRTEYDSPPATRHGNPSTRGRGGEMRLGQHRVTSPDNYSHPWRGKNTSRAYSPVSDRRGPKALPLAQRLRDP